MQLTDHAYAVAALPIGGDLRLEPNLKVGANPNHARIDGTGGDKAVASLLATGVDIWNSTIGIR